MQAFSSAIRRTFVQHFTRFQLTACSRGPSAAADVLFVVSSAFYRNAVISWFASVLSAGCVLYLCKSAVFLFIILHCCKHEQTFYTYMKHISTSPNNVIALPCENETITFHTDNALLKYEKTLQHICDHNSGKSWWILISFTYLKQE